MGEAKRRGSFEQRQEEAIQKEKEYQAKRAAMIAERQKREAEIRARRTPEERKASRNRTTALAMAAALTLCSNTHFR